MHREKKSHTNTQTIHTPQTHKGRDGEENAQNCLQNVIRLYVVGQRSIQITSHFIVQAHLEIVTYDDVHEPKSLQLHVHNKQWKVLHKTQLGEVERKSMRQLIIHGTHLSMYLLQPFALQSGMLFGCLIDHSKDSWPCSTNISLILQVNGEGKVLVNVHLHGQSPTGMSNIHGHGHAHTYTNRCSHTSYIHTHMHTWYMQTTRYDTSSYQPKKKHLPQLSFVGLRGGWELRGTSLNAQGSIQISGWLGICEESEGHGEESETMTCAWHLARSTRKTTCTQNKKSLKKVVQQAEQISHNLRLSSATDTVFWNS
mgnify:CR=1 FL=1